MVTDCSNPIHGYFTSPLSKYFSEAVMSIVAPSTFAAREKIRPVITLDNIPPLQPPLTITYLLDLMSWRC